MKEVDYREFIPDVRNKLTPARTALQKLVAGEPVPPEFLKLALSGIEKAVSLFEEVFEKNSHLDQSPRKDY